MVAGKPVKETKKEKFIQIIRLIKMMKLRRKRRRKNIIRKTKREKPHWKIILLGNINKNNRMLRVRGRPLLLTSF